MRWSCRLLTVLLVTVLLFSVSSMADEAISAMVVMRVAKTTQHAVVNAGEDLILEVGISGEKPASYQWYFENVAIPGADSKAYTLENAKPEESGIYRVDAFSADGRMLVSMEIQARVIDTTLPKAGDDSLPVVYAYLALAAGVVLMGTLLYKRRRVGM